MPRRYGRSSSSPLLIFSVVAIVVGIILYLLVAFLASAHPYVTWLIAWNLAAFAFYGFDKLQSRHGGLRVPELVLHGLALIGGPLGAVVGMFVWRHKTRHTQFLIVAGIGAALHGLLLYLLVLR